MAQIGISSEVRLVHLCGRNLGFYAKLPINIFTIRQKMRMTIEFILLSHVPKLAQIGLSSEVPPVHLYDRN